MKVWVVLRNTWVGDGGDHQVTVDRVFSTEESAHAYAAGAPTYSIYIFDVDGPHEVEPASSAMPPTKWEHVVNNPNFTITISKAKELKRGNR